MSRENRAVSSNAQGVRQCDFPASAECDRGGIVMIISLCAVLTALFFSSVLFYDDIESYAATGALSGGVEYVKEYISDNAAIAAFLGLGGDAFAVSGSADDSIAMRAAEYIKTYNEKFEYLMTVSGLKRMTDE